MRKSWRRDDDLERSGFSFKLVQGNEMSLPAFLEKLIGGNPPKARRKFDVKPLLEGDLEYGTRIYAEAAEYGGAGELWKVWREIQKLRGKDCEEAVQDLGSQGRRSFAKWAFANNKSDEGEIAYKAYLKEPGDIGPFDHENGVFLDYLLGKERWQEVIETVDQMKAEYDDVPWEESRAVRAELALGKAANAVKRLETVLDRHHDSGDYWAFSAIVHAGLGEKQQADLAFQECVHLGCNQRELPSRVVDGFQGKPKRMENSAYSLCLRRPETKRKGVVEKPRCPPGALH
jgi:hypothetical protein